MCLVSMGLKQSIYLKMKDYNWPPRYLPMLHFLIALVEMY